MSTTITIELSDAVADQLAADAEAQGQPVETVLAADVSELFDTTESADDLAARAYLAPSLPLREAIQGAIADMEAGKSLTMEEVERRSDAAMAARRQRKAAA